MNKSELKQKLIDEKIPISSYWLDEKTPCFGEIYCLKSNKDGWQVYYSERGRKIGLKSFSKEEEACEYFYNKLIKTLKNMKLI